MVGQALCGEQEAATPGAGMSDQQPTGKNVSGRQGSSHTDMEDESNQAFPTCVRPLHSALLNEPSLSVDCRLGR